MSDFPQAPTTTTTTTTTVTGGRLHLDISYIKTIPGILRIVEIILCIILFICAVTANTTWGGSFGASGWGAFVGFVGFLLVIAWLVFYLFHVHEAAANVPWLLIEMICYAIWTFFLIIAGIALAVLSGSYAGLYCNNLILRCWWNQVHSAAGAASFFAFAAAVVFGFQTFLIFRDWRNRTASLRSPIQGHP